MLILGETSTNGFNAAKHGYTIVIIIVVNSGGKRLVVYKGLPIEDNTWPPPSTIGVCLVMVLIL